MYQCISWCESGGLKHDKLGAPIIKWEVSATTLLCVSKPSLGSVCVDLQLREVLDVVLISI